MFVRFLLFTTGLASFLYFLFPQKFENLSPQKDVLGISNINASVNKPTLESVLLAFCINEGKLPENLNELYNGYLREERKLDLDKIFKYKKISNRECKYQLKAASND